MSIDLHWSLLTCDTRIAALDIGNNPQLEVGRATTKSHLVAPDLNRMYYSYVDSDLWFKLNRICCGTSQIYFIVIL